MITSDEELSVIGDGVGEYIGPPIAIELEKKLTPEEIKKLEIIRQIEKAYNDNKDKMTIMKSHYNYNNGVDIIRRLVLIIKAPRPIKLTVPLTGEVEVFEDIQILVPEGYSKPFIVSSENFKFRHYNVSSELNKFNIFINETKTKEYWCQDICNSISCDNIFKNLEWAVNVLLNNLEAPNPSDAYGSQVLWLQEHVSLRSPDAKVCCKVCGACLKKTDNPLLLIKNVCPLCIDADNLKIGEIEETGFYVKKHTRSDYKYFSTLSHEMSKDLSDYYPVFTPEQIKTSLLNIQKIDRDIIVMGLGSAGSNIVEQLGRTTLVDSFVLIDYDTVEIKNLRNQIYTEGDRGSNKTYCVKNFLNSINKKNVKEFRNRFENVEFMFMRTKYIVLGFDSINTRLKAFNKVNDGSIECKYIIDTRYLDLEASIYFINTSNKNEMSYYYNNLISDGAILNEAETKIKPKPLLIKDIRAIFTEYRVLRGRCRQFNRDVLGNGDCTMCADKPAMLGCGSTKCLGHAQQMILESGVNLVSKLTPDMVKKMWQEGGCFDGRCHAKLMELTGSSNDGCESICESPDCINFLVRTLNSHHVTPESSCIKQNIVDIYKFASSYVTAAVREIEEERDKPFVHIEVSTNGLPAMMKVR